jgi:hypothetical protein
MATGSNGSAAAPEFKVIVRVFIVLRDPHHRGVARVALLPRSQTLGMTSLDTLFVRARKL